MERSDLEHGDVEHGDMEHGDMEQSDLEQSNHKTGSGKATSFLVLPVEIRIKIYRFLLCQAQPIGTSAALHPSIIATCHEVYRDALPILYGENTFQINVWGDWGIGRVSFLGFENAIGGFALKRMRRFEILVDIQYKLEVRNIQSAVQTTCLFLSQLPRLDHLRIELLRCYSMGCSDTCGSFFPMEFCRVLRSFTSLRNVRRVVLERVPPRYAQYLEYRMGGDLVLDRLTRMYDALESYAGSFDCDASLQKACNAMEEGDIDDFKYFRAEIINSVTQQMEGVGTTKRLFNHDDDNQVQGCDWGYHHEPWW